MSATDKHHIVATAKQVLSNAKRVSNQLSNGALDMLFPPTCLACDAPTMHANALCASCWSDLTHISKPYCPVLGVPFAADLGSQVISAQAIASPPHYARARSAVLYDDVARQLVGHLKYRDRLEMAKFCGQLMFNAGSDFWGEPCVLVPVPLHWRRRLSRRYNQSQLLADEIGKLSGSAIQPNWLKRRRDTKRQVGLSSKVREQNVRGAFIVTDDFLSQYEGQRIVIIDDVVTTGATIDAIARAFRSKYRDKIDVLSFARVVTGPIGAI